MTDYDDIVLRVVLLSKLPGAGRRREIERELRAHVEDIVEQARSLGHDDQAIRRIVEVRFGKPHEVAAAFAHAYARERLARGVLVLAVLLVASLGAVGLVIAGVQSIAAIWTATPMALAFKYIHWELFGFLAITLGYCSLYLGERLFPASLAKTVLLSSILICGIWACLSWVVPGHVTLPVVAFTCAAFGRLLQRVHIPLLWLAGTAAPLLIAGLFFGPLMSDHGQFPWLVWLGLTISCRVLQSIVKLFERFVFVESFV